MPNKKKTKKIDTLEPAHNKQQLLKRKMDKR